jgi:release factor glutamine methyltransferase
MTANLRIDALLGEGVRTLQSGPHSADPSATPALDAEILLAHVLGVSRARLRSHPEETPDHAAATHYRELVSRRAGGEPLAYILGTKDFWTLRLSVSPAVLVPRPETELLVERALALCDRGTARVADLGTGSGAIALALASERPGWRIVATDISDAALTVARTNAARLGLAAVVEFLQGSWFEPLRGRKFDLIVSNPPYIRADDPALHSLGLKHEPQNALTPGPNGLASIETIAAGAPDHLERGGWLLLEHGADQGPDVRRALVARGFTHVRSHRDLAGHERMTEARQD